MEAKDFSFRELAKLLLICWADVRFCPLKNVFVSSLSTHFTAHDFSYNVAQIIPIFHSKWVWLSE